MSEITTTISTIPSAGQRGVQSRDDFVTAQEGFQDHLVDNTVDEMNDVASEMNVVASEVNTNATIASDSATEASNSALVATGHANFKGEWVAGFETTGYTLGYSVSYTDGYNYVSKINNNLVEPTTLTNTAEWDYVEAVSPADLALKADKANPTFTGIVTAPIIDTPTLTNSSYNQIADVSVGAALHTFNFANGDMQQHTSTGAGTIAFSGFPTGKVVTFIIDAVDWGDYTPTNLAAVLNSGADIAFTSGGTDRLLLIKDKDENYDLVRMIENMGGA